MYFVLNFLKENEEVGFIYKRDTESLIDSKSKKNKNKRSIFKVLL